MYLMTNIDRNVAYKYFMRNIGRKAAFKCLITNIDRNVLSEKHRQKCT